MCKKKEIKKQQYSRIFIFLLILYFLLLSLFSHPSICQRAKRKDRRSQRMNYEFCLVILSVSRCCWKISEHANSGWFKHERTAVIKQEIEKKGAKNIIRWYETSISWVRRPKKWKLEVERQAVVTAAVTLTVALSLINCTNGATPTFTFQRKYVNDCQRRRTPSIP